MVEKVDNSIYDFLNRESIRPKINPSVLNDTEKVGNDILRGYQEVHVKDYISPL